METVRRLETSKKQLAFSDDFKRLIHEHPHTLKTFLALAEKIKNNNSLKEIRDGDVTVTAIIKPIADYPAYNYHVTIGTQQFFVKEELTPEKVKGYQEFMSSFKAKKLLSDLPWVRVIDLRLGYQDQSGRSYFVTQWQNLPLLATSQQQLRNTIRANNNVPEATAALESLDQRIKYLQSILKDFDDIGNLIWNSFYDPEHDQIVLFDLSAPNN